LRRYFGVVWQDSTVFNGTFRDNITYNRENIAIEELRYYALQANALEFIE
jgi:ABC-type multidrug transport system fused ATPase/permease subunit